MRKNFIFHRAGNAWLIFSESVNSFIRNNDLKSASSLAFYFNLALIPSLFLLTYLLGSAVGSSQKALVKTHEIVVQFIPRFSEVILKEVSSIASHKKALGTVNLLILLWSITPLVAAMRGSFALIFRTGGRSILRDKIWDVLVIILLLIGLSAAAVVNVVFKYLKTHSVMKAVPGFAEQLAPFIFIFLTILFIYYVFTPKVKFTHLLAGSLTTCFLWFIMRPAFGLFLSFNPGYGFTFGSFKSIFIVIIWIYYSQIIFLFGAEVTAALDRRETILVRRLMEGKKPFPGSSRFVSRFEKDNIIFREGDPGDGMYFVLNGSVSIRNGDREIAVIHKGKSFGEMAFLLSEKRTASAVAVEETELIRIDNGNVDSLMRESPEYIRRMLTEMALRLKDANRQPRQD